MLLIPREFENSKKELKENRLLKRRFLYFRAMILKPVTLLYIITVVVLVGAIVWEYYIQQWMTYQPNGGVDVIRTDLFVIWPLVLMLVAVSLFRFIKGRK